MRHAGPCRETARWVAGVSPSRPQPRAGSSGRVTRFGGASRGIRCKSPGFPGSNIGVVFLLNEPPDAQFALRTVLAALAQQVGESDRRLSLIEHEKDHTPRLQTLRLPVPGVFELLRAPSAPAVPL